jgi:hypothetical protein
MLEILASFSAPAVAKDADANADLTDQPSAPTA